jgi:hypothetical protein
MGADARVGEARGDIAITGASMAGRAGTAAVRPVVLGFGVGCGAIAGTHPITVGFRMAAGSLDLNGPPEAGIDRKTFRSARPKERTSHSPDPGTGDRPGVSTVRTGRQKSTESSSRMVHKARPTHTKTRWDVSMS